MLFWPKFMSEIKLSVKSIKLCNDHKQYPNPKTERSKLQPDKSGYVLI